VTQPLFVQSSNLEGQPTDISTITFTRATYGGVLFALPFVRFTIWPTKIICNPANGEQFLETSRTQTGTEQIALLQLIW